MFGVGTKLEFIKEIPNLHNVTIGKVYTIHKVMEPEKKSKMTLGGQNERRFVFLDDNGLPLNFKESDTNRALEHFKDVTRREKLKVLNTKSNV